MYEDNYRGSNFLGGNYPGGNNPGGNCPGDNYPGSNCPGGNFPGGQLSGAIVLEPILLILRSAPLPNLLADASDRMRNAFSCSLPDVANSILLLNSFITRSTMNYLEIKEGQENLYDVSPLGANHPFLIFERKGNCAV